MKKATAFLSVAVLAWLSGCASSGAAGEPILDAALEAELQDLASRSDGRLGVCALEGGARIACVNGDQRFSLQSVMKLVVGAAAMHAVDRRGWRLDEEVVLRREDLSLHVQPLARIVRDRGEFRTTLGDLIERAVVESDSAATDYLFDRLGGAPALAEFLRHSGVDGGLRVDRDERRLQTEITGVVWRSEFVDPAKLREARERLTPEQKRAAFEAYLSDPRDTATPLAMVEFLARLAQGQILSEASTEHFLGVMRRTRTFPTRLRAGAPSEWTVAHKTGTSSDFDGLNAVTNDVGVFTTSDGRTVAIAVFLAESRRVASERDAVLAAVARSVSAAWRVPSPELAARR